MAAEAALPSYAWLNDGAILTFVIPAFEGCNLACPYCYIDQRGEDDLQNTLWAGDYSQFVRQVMSSRPVASVCIQGYEPLLPDTFPYTRVILATGKWLGIPTSIVTNGTYLAERVEELRVLAPARLSVSLDAANAETHDRQRGKVGAFEATVDGLRKAAPVLPATTELVVTSVLIPKRRRQLDAMPALLKELGVKRWVVTALLRVRDDNKGGPVGEREKILADLRILHQQAQDAGIEFKVDDEFDGLARTDGRDSGEFEKNRIRRLVNPDGVYRLVPDGRCSKGTDILKPLSDQTPRWDPTTQDAAAFLDSL